MSIPQSDEQSTRVRMVAVLERILGYEVALDIEDLSFLDSLQVIELLVSLEDEFEVDSERIIVDPETAWWVSLSDLVASIDRLHAGAAASRDQ